MKRSAGPKEGWNKALINDNLTNAHKFILESANAPSMALLKGKASRSDLLASIRKLRLAIDLLQEVVDA